jgi:hypothetical protein
VARTCFAALGLGIALGHRHAGHVGDLLHGLGKGNAVELGQEAEMITRHAAAEAVIAALLVLAVEARRLFAVERAAGPVIAARGVGLALVPGDALADHVGNGNAVADLVEK